MTDQTPRDLLGRPVRIPRAVRQGDLMIPHTAEEIEELARRAREANQPATTPRDPFTLDLFGGNEGGKV